MNAVKIKYRYQSVLCFVMALCMLLPTFCLCVGAEDGFIELDLSYGSITFTDTEYTYYIENSDEKQTGTHEETNKYRIVQKDAGTATTNVISVGTEDSPVTENFEIHLAGVNIRNNNLDGIGHEVYSQNNMIQFGYAAFYVNASEGATVAVVLDNNTENFLYSGRNRAGLEKAGDSKGLLLIACQEGYEAWLEDPEGHSGHTDASNYSGCTGACGYLDARSGNAWSGEGYHSYYAGAGIGTCGHGNNGDKDYKVGNNNSLINLTIAGGNISAMGGWGNSGAKKNGTSSGGGAAIGIGSASSRNVTAGSIENLIITGGTINAYRSDNSAACIGGGYRAGYANIAIYGGTINAGLNENGERVENDIMAYIRIRAAAIGGGGGGTSSASPQGATVTIHGGKIFALGQYGSAIGAGAGGTSGAASAGKVYIKGGYIYAVTVNPENKEEDGAGAAIGTGGSLDAGKGGKATIQISGGTIYAQSQYGADIGGGGTNSTSTSGAGGQGIVSISGGDIHSLNGGIGGGRANKGVGGDADVTISGGVINATAIGGGDSKTNTGGTATVTVEDNAWITLSGNIGGGSSTSGKGGSAEVTMNGGYLKCQGVGGGNSTTKLGGGATVIVNGGEIDCTGVIGGGNSTDQNGGTATVTVNSGKITAKGVGGGDSVNATGGTATVTVTGGRITAQTIGGGDSQNGTGGTANVTVDAGTLVSTGIGGGFSETKGYAPGSVTVNGGSLNSSMAATPKNTKGDTLYLTRIAFFEGEDAMKEQKVESLQYGQAGFRYSTKDVYTDSIGMIYVWLPAGTTVVNGQLTDHGTEGNLDNFTPNNEDDRDIDANDVGSLIHDSARERYTVTIAGSNVYSLSMDKEMYEFLSGAAIVPSGTFTYYLQLLDTNYSLTTYSGTTDSEGNKIIAPLTASALTEIERTDEYILYCATIYVQSNTAVWYAMSYTDDNGKTQSVFNVDLTNGDVEITETDNGLTITQNGYTLSGFTGELFITSAGFPTSNSVTVNSVKTGDSNIRITMDELNVISEGSAIVIESGNVDLSFGEKDNMIHSVDTAPIAVGEDATLNLATEGKESIKVSTSSQDSALITGAGTLNLNNQGGFLNIQEKAKGTSQIAVGQYNFEGENDQFTTELYKGHYSYTVVGFLQDDTLHPLTSTPEDGKRFMARGIKEIYNTEDLSSDFKVENGMLIYTLEVKKNGDTISMYKITDADQNDITGELTKTSTKDSNNNITKIEIQIPAEYFKNGNLTVNAAVNKKIPYEVVGNTKYAYDAKGHGIEVLVDSSIFKVYYSTETITEETIDQCQTQPITKTDVGVYTIHYYICEKDNADTSKDYDPAPGSATFEIVQSDNEWTSTLVCSDIVCGNAPQARAVSKWGNVVYTYHFAKAYTDADGKPHAENDPIEFEHIATLTAKHTDAANPIEFYVTASVKGNQNYRDLTSKKIYFKAIVLSAYTQDGRQLDEITKPNTGTLQIAETGAFSVYFGSTASGQNSNLVLGTALPEGTKVTLISFNADGTADYYYYFVQERDIADATTTTTLMLSDFKVMGTETTYTPPTSGSVEYQFCFDYAGLAGGEFGICLNGNENAKPMVNCQFDWKEQLQAIQAAQDAERLRVQGGDKEISISVQPNMAGAGNKYLAFKVTGTAPGGNQAFSLINMETALSVLLDNHQTIEIQPIYSSGDFVLFRIGDTAASVNSVYTLVLSNVQEGTYKLKVTADVRMLTTELSGSYALFGINQDNHVEVEKEIEVSGKTHIYTELKSGYPVISSNDDTLKFSLRANEELQESGLTVSIYRKNRDGKYELYHLNQAPASEIRVDLENVSGQEGTFSCPEQLITLAENGTYRLEFHYGGATFIYNVIVDK